MLFWGGGSSLLASSGKIVLESFPGGFSRGFSWRVFLEGFPEDFLEGFPGGFQDIAPRMLCGQGASPQAGCDTSGAAPVSAARSRRGFGAGESRSMSPFPTFPLPRCAGTPNPHFECSPVWETLCFGIIAGECRGQKKHFILGGFRTAQGTAPPPPHKGTDLCPGVCPAWCPWASPILGLMLPPKSGNATCGNESQRAVIGAAKNRGFIHRHVDRAFWEVGGTELGWARARGADRKSVV